MVFRFMKVEISTPDGTDGYGQARFKSIPSERVAPVRLQFEETHTTVRTDSAGSRGHASEPAASVVVLAGSRTKITTGCRLVIRGHSLKVVSIHDRFTVGGRLDHREIHCEGWV